MFIHRFKLPAGVTLEDVATAELDSQPAHYTIDVNSDELIIHAVLDESDMRELFGWRVPEARWISTTEYD